MLLGLGVFVLGLVGAFFGRLIMAAVSRQREYLADASAVQFTRNSDGIAGALKKIGGLAEGSRIANPQAAEVGHMFFANALGGGGLAGLLATHPPLVERIRRLDPQFDGQFPEVRPVGVDRAELEGPWGRVPPVAGMPRLPGLPQVPLPVLGFADETASRIGRVDPEEISYAQALHEGMPDVLRAAAQEPFIARALVYALLLDPQADLRDLQLTRLKAGVEPQDFTETLRLVAPVQALPDTHRLPLLDLAMPALRQMSPRQHRAFRAQVEVLMIADHRLSLFEYTLRCVLHRHLDAQFLPRRQTRPVHSSLKKLAHPVATVLALLAWEGSRNPTRPPGLSIRACAVTSAATTPTACRPATNARLPSSTRRCKSSIDPSRPSSAGSLSPARPASLRISRSPSAKRSCSAPFAIRSTARYRRSKRNDHGDRAHKISQN